MFSCHHASPLLPVSPPPLPAACAQDRPSWCWSSWCKQQSIIEPFLFPRTLPVWMIAFMATHLCLGHGQVWGSRFESGWCESERFENLLFQISRGHDDVGSSTDQPAGQLECPHYDTTGLPEEETMGQLSHLPAPELPFIFLGAFLALTLNHCNICPSLCHLVSPSSSFTPVIIFLITLFRHLILLVPEEMRNSCPTDFSIISVGKDMTPGFQRMPLLYPCVQSHT